MTFKMLIGMPNGCHRSLFKRRIWKEIWTETILDSDCRCNLHFECRNLWVNNCYFLYITTSSQKILPHDMGLNCCLHHGLGWAAIRFAMRDSSECETLRNERLFGMQFDLQWETYRIERLFGTRDSSFRNRALQPQQKIHEISMYQHEINIYEIYRKWIYMTWLCTLTDV